MGALVYLIYCIMSARVRIDVSNEYEDDYLFDPYGYRVSLML